MKWLRPLFHRSAVEREMDAELRFHCEQLVEELMAKGATREEAQRAARIQFGALEQVKDEARDVRTADRLERIARSLRMAARSLGRTPAFTVTAIAILALGIGANTLIFTALDQAILRSLLLPHPEQLVVFRSLGPNPGMDRNSDSKMSFSYPKYLDFRDRSDVFEGVLARFATPGSLMSTGTTEMVNVELVTGNYFEILGVKPAAGRLFTPEDEKHYLNDPFAVLSYSYWQRRFGGDRGIVGQKLTINGMAMTIVGVAARDFHGIERGSGFDLWAPMTMKNLFTPTWQGGFKRREWAWLNIVARVKTGLTRRQAESRANVLYHQILQDEAQKLPKGAEELRSQFLTRYLDLLPASGGITDPFSGTKTFLMELEAMAGIVLLITCVNLAGLLMARTAARQRELAIRLALCAGRVGVARLLLAENLLVAAAGGALGIALAALLGRPAITLLLSEDATNLYKTSPDGRILLFALAATVFTAIVVSLAPALEARRVQPADSLKSETGASAGHGQVRLRKAMVVAQVAFCVWLLMTAGLFARTLSRLRAVDLGFRKENLVVFGLDPTQIGIKSDASIALTERLELALAAIPGVQAVSFSNFGVFGGMNIQRVGVPGYQGKDSSSFELYTTCGHAKALGLHLLAGRDFEASDVGAPPKTALVNESFAKKYYGGKNPIGQIFSAGGILDLEIVGVVANQKWWSQRDVQRSAYYIPEVFPAGGTFYVRTALAPASLMDTIRKVVQRETVRVPIIHMRTMEENMDLRLSTEKQMMRLAALFGLLASVLAAIGLYGVMAYTVARRTREIGVRMALGAACADVLRMILVDVASVIVTGLVIGLPSGYVMAHLVKSQLFNVSVGDPWALSGAALAVSMLTVLAGLLPARRATKIDPSTALRWD